MEKKTQPRLSYLAEPVAAPVAAPPAAAPVAAASNGLHSAEEEEPSVWTLPKNVIPLEVLLATPEEADAKGQKLVCKQSTLNGWVEQTSPCCAAASVAGAFNALQRIHSSDGRAVRPERVLPILQQQVEADFAEKLSACARALHLPGQKGIGPLGLLLRCVEVHQARKGRPLTGRKKECVTVSQLRQALREVVAAGTAQPEARTLMASSGECPGEAEEQVLWQRLKWPEGAERAEGTNGRGTNGMHHAHHAYAQRSHAHRLALAAATLTAGQQQQLGASAPAAAPELASAADPELPALREEAAVIKLCQAYMGRLKIMGGVPSTSAVGNAHMIMACGTLASELELCVRASKFCSQREPTTGSWEIELPLHEDDPPEVVEMQWRRFCQVNDDADAVLLLHFHNHYALVYAVREWRHATTGVMQREILTAKPAQRPCRWLPWGELRKWLLQWQGYTVFRVDIQRDALPSRSQQATAATAATEARATPQRGSTGAPVGREALAPTTFNIALPGLAGASEAPPAPTHGERRHQSVKGRRDAGKAEIHPSIHPAANMFVHGPVSLR